jgi:hypothetical protein
VQAPAMQRQQRWWLQQPSAALKVRSAAPVPVDHRLSLERHVHLQSCAQALQPLFAVCSALYSK